MATKLTDDTLKKAFEDEEIFVLRALDESSPTVIMFWIAYNFAVLSEEKIRSAFEVAMKMNRQENRRRAT